MSLEGYWRCNCIKFHAPRGPTFPAMPYQQIHDADERKCNECGSHRPIGYKLVKKWREVRKKYD